MKTKTNYFDLQIRFMEFCEANNIDKIKYFIYSSDVRLDHLVAIFEHYGTDGSINPVSDFMTNDGLIQWMKGYTAANKLNLFK